VLRGHARDATLLEGGSDVKGSGARVCDWEQWAVGSGLAVAWCGQHVALCLAHVGAQHMQLVMAQHVRAAAVEV
jgi:hypothetical protein